MSCQGLVSVISAPRVRMQIIADHVLSRSVDFSRTTPTDFTLISLNRVISNSLFYNMPVKKWVEGFDFFAWGS